MSPPAKPGATLVVKRHIIRDKVTIERAGQFAMNKAEIDRLNAEQEKLKPLLMDAMGAHTSVVAGNRILTRNEVPGIEPSPTIVITKAMVGSSIPGKNGRKGYTTLTVQ